MNALNTGRNEVDAFAFQISAYRKFDLFAVAPFDSYPGIRRNKMKILCVRSPSPYPPCGISSFISYAIGMPPMPAPIITICAIVLLSPSLISYPVSCLPTMPALTGSVRATFSPGFNPAIPQHRHQCWSHPISPDEVLLLPLHPQHKRLPLTTAQYRAGWNHQFLYLAHHEMGAHEHTG